MSEEGKEEIKKPKKKGFFRTLRKIFLRTAITLLAFVILLSISLMILTQYQGFRTWAIGFIMNQVSTLLVGKVEIGDILFSTPEGIILKKVRVMAAGDTVAYIPRIAVDMEFTPILKEKIIIHRATLDRPKFKILRSLVDSTWNVEKIAKPSEDTTTTKSNLLLNITNFRIIDASLLLIDSTLLKPVPDREFSFMRLDLDSLNLQVAAKAQIAKNDFNATLRNLKFIDRFTGFRLENLTLYAILNEKGANIDKMFIETAKSSLELSASISNINLFGKHIDSEFPGSQLYCSLKSEKFNSNEINTFVWLPFNFRNEYELSLEASGVPDSINIQSLELFTGKTNINLSGRLKNLTKPEKFEYFAHFRNTKITLNDAIRNLDGINLSSVPDLAYLKMQDAEVLGRNDSISLKIDGETKAGKVKGRAGVGFRRDLTYSADINATNLNLGPIARSKDLISDITGRIIASGHGTDMKNIHAVCSLNLENSTIYKSRINHTDLRVRLSDSGIIHLDTAFFDLKDTEKEIGRVMSTDINSFLKLDGYLDIRNTSTPKYSFNAQYQALNLARILALESAPSYVTGSTTIAANGFELDSLVGSFDFMIDECVFKDRAMVPFNANLNFDRPEDGTRYMKLRSNYADADLSGNFSYSSLIPMVANNADYLVSYLKNKISSVNPAAFRDTSGIGRKIGSFSPLQMKLKANIKDISPIALFVKDFDLFVEAAIDLHFNTTLEKSEIFIDSININRFNLRTSAMSLASNPVKLSGNYNIFLQDSLPQLQSLLARFESVSNFYYNDLVLTNPGFDIRFNQRNADLSFSTAINNIVKIYGNGSLNFYEKYLELILDSSVVNFIDKFTWTGTSPFVLDYDSDGFNLINLVMSRAGAEEFKARGTYKNKVFTDANLQIYHFPIHDLMSFLPDEQKKIIKELKGQADSISITLSGPMDNPAIDAVLSGSGLVLNNTQLGNLKSSLAHRNGSVAGSIDLSRTNENNTIKTLSADIRRLPLDLAFTGVTERIHNREPFDIKISANKLPLVLINPFVPAVEDLQGDGYLDLYIFGFAPKDVGFKGRAVVNNASLILQPNNLRYFAEGEMEFVTDNVTIKKLVLKNHPLDLQDGIANIEGNVRLNNLNIDYVDINITSKRIKMLGDASVKPMPDLYGDFIISTGPAPLHFYGPLSAPSLEGDVNVLMADLKMPEKSGSKVSRSALKYVKKNDIVYITEAQKPDSITQTANGSSNIEKKEAEGSGRSIADLINYKLNIKFLGQFVVNMNIVSSQLVAQIGSLDATVPIQYVKMRDNPEANLFGDILVKSGSTLKMYRVFNTSGKLSFPTGSMYDPGLELNAEYSGRSQVGGQTKNYTVKMLITGTKNKPKIAFSYIINGVEETGDSTRINENALFLLLMGKTKADFLAGNSGGESYINNAVTSFLSTETSKVLTDLFSGTGVIQSADIDFAGGDISAARLKISGRLIGDVSWELGGTVADFASNNTISIDVPLAQLLSSNLNMNVQLSKSTNFSTSPSLDQKDWEIKFKLGGSW